MRKKRKRGEEEEKEIRRIRGKRDVGDGHYFNSP
jgi:hypothetical protein